MYVANLDTSVCSWRYSLLYNPINLGCYAPVNFRFVTSPLLSPGVKDKMQTKVRLFHNNPNMR